MPAIDSAALVVARFLKANQYEQSYQAFITEAGLPEDAGDVTSTSLTIERLLEEKRLYDQSVNFEKLDLEDGGQKGWKIEAPNSPLIVNTLPGKSNILNVVADSGILYTSTSDRRINSVSLADHTLQASWLDVQDAPVLSQLILYDRYHVSSSMSGSLVVADIKTGVVVSKRKDHSKYIVALAFDGKHTLASAGWDSVVHLYKVQESGILEQPYATITLSTKPESILFVRRPVDDEQILVLTRTDSSRLHFYSTGNESILLGQQNLAPYSNAWVAFTPTSCAICPTNPQLIAVATNSTPHMKLIIAKLLLPDGTAPIASVTPQAAALTQQALADREHEAIKLHCNTLSGQTPYSTPLVVWRPHGQGVWVNSDDGIIRGIDVVSGKVMSELREHDIGSKVRTLWAGSIDSGDDILSECLLSGGFDHKLISWRLEN